MKSRVALLALLALVACFGVHSSMEEDVFDAVMTSWDDVGLPRPMDWCRIEAFRIEQPAELASFQKSCSGVGRPPEQVMADSCFLWRLEAPAARTLLYPAAVISPQLPMDRHAAAASHELLHALSECALGDPDPDHSDERVWEGKRKSPRINSVEYRAEIILYGPLIGAAE